LLTLSLVRVKVFGGEQGPASIIAPKMGKLKISARKVQQEIEKFGT
jgi:ribosomal protein L11